MSFTYLGDRFARDGLIGSAKNQPPTITLADSGFYSAYGLPKYVTLTCYEKKALSAKNTLGSQLDNANPCTFFVNSYTARFLKACAFNKLPKDSLQISPDPCLGSFASKIGRSVACSSLRV